MSIGGKFMGPYGTLASCIRDRNYAPLRPFLDSDCVLTSTWVSTDLCGATNIMRYLTAKAQKQRKAGFFPNTRLGFLLSYKPGAPCVAIYQGNTDPDIIVLLETKKHLISKIGFYSPELFEYSFDPDVVDEHLKKISNIP